LESSRSDAWLIVFEQEILAAYMHCSSLIIEWRPYRKKVYPTAVSSMGTVSDVASNPRLHLLIKFLYMHLLG